MFVFPLPNTSTWNTIKTPKWETCNKNKSSSAAKGTKGQETEVALYLINLQLPNACPSLSRRCSTMQFFPTSRINKTPGLFFCSSLNTDHAKNKNRTTKKQTLESVKAKHDWFLFCSPLFVFLKSHSIMKSPNYSTWALQSSRHLSEGTEDSDGTKWRCFLTNSWAVI